MGNPFAGQEIAAGYGRWRPRVHGEILSRAAAALGWTVTFPVAVDVGCGAGISTGALAPYASRCIGIDPVESMVRVGPSLARDASFVAGSAEALPFASASADLVTAAGSANYVHLPLLFSEVRRVLKINGVLLIYDLRTGRRFADSMGLEEWFAAFIDRYPWPQSEATVLDPTILADVESGMDLVMGEKYEVRTALSPEFYLEYMLTETNVAAAVRRGEGRAT